MYTINEQLVVKVAINGALPVKAASVNGIANLRSLRGPATPTTILATCLPDMSWTKISGGLAMRQWRHEPPAPNFWAKKSAPHSDSVQIFEVINALLDIVT